MRRPFFEGLSGGSRDVYRTQKTNPSVWFFTWYAPDHPHITFSKTKTAAQGYLTFMLDGLRRLWPEFDVELQKSGGMWVGNPILFLSVMAKPWCYSTCAGDFKLHYGGLHVATPYDNHPHLSVSTMSLPQMFILRRSRLQCLLQRLLLKNCPDIHLVDGTVRTIVPSLDQGQIQSVIVRTLDGSNLILDDISLVIGELKSITAL